MRSRILDRSTERRALERWSNEGGAPAADSVRERGPPGRVVAAPTAHPRKGTPDQHLGEPLNPLDAITLGALLPRRRVE